MSSLSLQSHLPQPEALRSSSSALGPQPPLPSIEELISEISSNRSRILFEHRTPLPGERLELVDPLSLSPALRAALAPHPHSNSQPDQTGLFDIYRCTTRHAQFFIESIDRYLSNETILHLLIKPGKLLWFYDVKPDGTQCGYIAVYEDPTSPEKQPHTFVGITWYRHSQVSLLDRLRSLGREEAGQLPFWPAFVGAVTACDQAHSVNPSFVRNVVTDLPVIFAAVTQVCYKGGSLDAPPKVIRASAQNIANEIANLDPGIDHRFGSGGMDAPGLALYWQELGKVLWQPITRKKLAALQIQAEEGAYLWKFLAMLADYWLNLVSGHYLEITVSGLRLKFDISANHLFGLWFQTLEMDRIGIPAEALRYLQPRQVFQRGDSPPFILADGYDGTYGDALADQLLAEAKARGAYVPSGAFRMAVPAGMPITTLEGIYVWTDGKEMWVLSLPGGAIFHWRPDVCKTSFLWGTESERKSAWNLILSALWHDLVTQGPEVFVRTGGEQPALTANPGQGKKRRHRSRSRSNTHVLHLPSQRVIRLDGVHAWGTQEEIEKIKRQAHQVRGHRRKLLPGHRRSLYAQENARRFSFIIPDGYTFVKPYQTGLSDPDAPAARETPILARGLASLMLMSKDYAKRSPA